MTRERIEYAVIHTTPNSAGVLPALLLAAAADAKPNIILIIADDLGYGELGCYGQRIIRTPHLDRLAAEGMRFTQFYSGQAVCAPARCVLMTGKHTGHAYIRDNGDPTTDPNFASNKARYGWEFPGQNPIPESEVTMAELLQSQGYATAAIGKWGLGHFGTSGDPNLQGFDLFYGYNCQRHAHNHYPTFLWRNRTKEQLPGNTAELTGATHSQEKFIEVAKEFIAAQQNRPFFLYLPFAIPHLSIQAPEGETAKYTGRISEEDYKHVGYLKHPTPRAGYAGMVSYMDRGVGEIMQLLKDLNLDDNTLVLFTSDNGPTYERLGGSDSEFFQSASGLRGLKGSLYEGGIRVPLIARWPGHISPGTETDLVSAFWDLLPSLCDVAGATPPEKLDGLSLLPTWTGKADQQGHAFLYWEFPSYGGQQAVRMGKWKAIRQNMLQQNNPDPLRIELYDLSSDPAEAHNVARENPDVVDLARQVMQREHSPSKLFPIPPID